MPLFFLLIGYAILILLALPYIRPLSSIYSMVSQNQTPDFSNSMQNHFEEDVNLPTEGAVENNGSVSLADQYGTIEIPSVNINVPLMYGATDQALYYGAGQRVQSAKPGYGKPVMIGGHTIPYFKNLGIINNGDIITIRTYYGIFQYQVTGTAVAGDTDGSAYDLTQNKEQLILFTCYPLDGVGTKDERLFVYADKISGPEVVGANNE